MSARTNLRDSLAGMAGLALAASLLAAPGLEAQAPAASPQSPQSEVPGGPLYQKLCSQCHGEKGDGLGVAAPRLLPRPRDFTAGKYKIRRTPSGSLPTDDDLRYVIREGMPYTSMPPWKHLSDAEIDTLVAAVKSFSPDFANPERAPKPIAIPKAPSYSAESAKKGKEVYAKIGCAACHGESGRGDGSSAPLLKDDWGHPIRAADLTKRWTYRGGSTREDIYRTFTTGLNGTPMPSFAESLTDQERWQLVDYIFSLDPRDAPGYAELLQVRFTPEEIDLEGGPEKSKSLFDNAPPAYFPVVGQITEPGRAFHPAANGVTVRAIYNAREIAFKVTWHDMRADVTGKNAPDLVVPPDEEQAETTAPVAAAADEGDIWGGEETTEAPAADPAAAGDEGGDIWGEEGGEAGATAATPGDEFSDAIALQLPVQLSGGNRKPYFLFGDAQNPVDLWFVDLATKIARRYAGAGGTSLTAVEGEDVTAVASYDQGEWSVTLKRSLRGSGSVTFAPGQYVPVAFSVWDGFSRERGSKRGLTQWMYLYTMPQEAPSPIGPMLKAGLAVLAAEILLVAWVRRRRRPSPNGEVPSHV